MISTRLFFGLISAITFFSFTTQSEDEKQYQQVIQLRRKALQNNIIGKSYITDLVGNTDCNKTRIKYLGKITTTRNRTFKILTSFFVHGISCRGTSQLMIYDTLNRYVGDYFVGLPDELPDTLINNQLVYVTDAHGECKSRMGKTISFKYGLPQQLFIPCENNQSGQVYEFTSRE